MPNEHFCLKWNNFQRNIVAALGNLKLDEDFVDVTISCEGKLIKAHKVILSACSDYFRDLFRDNPCQHPVIILRDASYTDVEGLVRYVYRGEVDVQPQHLQSFLRTADSLKIKGLADQGLDQQQHHAQQPPSQSQQSIQHHQEENQDSNSFKSEEEEEMSDDENEDPTNNSDPRAPLDPIIQIQNSNSTRLGITSLQEPLKVPIPPSSQFRRSDSNSSVSSPEINPELQPPAAKKSRGVPLLLNNSSSSTTSTMDSNTTTPSGGGGGSTSIGFYNSVDFDGKSSVVPSLLLNNKNKADRQSFVNLPESRSSSLMIPSILPTILTSADEDTAYPQSSPSPASSSTGFLHPSSSPKHITKTETGSLDDQNRETNEGSSTPKIKKKKSKLKKTNAATTTAENNSSSNNNPDSGLVSSAGIRNNIVNNNSSCTSVSGINGSDDPNLIDNNNGDPGSQHPRNRWRCMQPRLCNYCWKTFSNSFNLKQHIVNVHIQSQGVSCSLCEKVVKNKWYLRKHLVTAHGAPLKRVTQNKNSKENGSNSLAAAEDSAGSSGENNPLPVPAVVVNSTTSVSGIRLSNSTC